MGRVSREPTVSKHGTIQLLTWKAAVTISTAPASNSGMGSDSNLEPSSLPACDEHTEQELDNCGGADDVIRWPRTTSRRLAKKQALFLPYCPIPT